MCSTFTHCASGMLNLSAVSMYNSAYAIFFICKIEGKSSIPELDDEGHAGELRNLDIIMEAVGSR